MKTHFPLDRSAMFSALLELSPGYAKLDSRKGEAITTEALEAWYADEAAKNMFRFAQRWIMTRRKDLLPLAEAYA